MNRPNPDALLARVQDEEPQAGRGHLKVFFGMAPGVGKTFAMLTEARDRVQFGEDVVAGVVVTHGRADTEAMLDGLEILPPRRVTHRKVTLEEFDLDAALARRPDIILVDELAHTNAPGSRHAKRWQDVLELVDAGFTVYTTINVQHLESLNDIVAQITGVPVRETVPDTVLERADEIELVDLSPQELRQRLRDGKVYVPLSVENALKNFFREGNLSALRELSLRRTAERVDAQMQRYRQAHGVPQVWAAGERILVCITPNPLAPRLVRTARRLAAELHAEWIVAHVVGAPSREVESRERLAESLSLAEKLGAETVLLSGEDIPGALLEYAREKNVSKIVIGKPRQPRWRERIFGSIVDEVIHRSGEIDIYVITGQASEERRPLAALARTPSSRAAAYAWTAAIVGLCTSISWVLHPYFSPANLTMVYLLGTLFAAAKLGRGPGIASAILGVLAFNFCFVPPHLTFAVTDTQYLFTFTVFLVTALVISTLTNRMKESAEGAVQRERATAALYSLSRELTSTRGEEFILQTGLRHLKELWDEPLAIFRPVKDELHPVGEVPTFAVDPKESGVARWVFDHGQSAGAGTDTLPAARALYIPLRASQAITGVLALQLREETDARRPVRLDPMRRRLLEACASLIAQAFERLSLAQEAQQAQLQVETERLRNSLLSSVSHDLRTPLASIMGAASGLLDSATLDEFTRTELTHDILNESGRLHRLVTNLLDMTRLQSGAVRVRKEWQPLEEVVGAALGKFEKDFAGRKVTTNLPEELPMVPIDGTLMGQVFINLLDNALKYSPETGSIHVAALPGEGTIMVEVSDRGPGIPEDQLSAVFDPFFRANQSGTAPADGRGTPQGTGLGLAIVRAIVEAHGGVIWVENRPRGGAVFRFTIPIEGTAPTVEEL